jgi:hypothetical protein
MFYAFREREMIQGTQADSWGRRFDPWLLSKQGPGPVSGHASQMLLMDCP